LNVDGSYLGSNAADSLGLAGTLSGAGIISLGAGNDLFTMRDSAILNATVDGGDAQAVGDTLVIDSADNFLLDTSRIVSFENLAKQNSGSMTLSGAGVFSNSINMDAGTLVSDVSLTASQINIALGSTLVASGSVTGNVSNAGTLALGTASFDRLVVRGSYLGVDGLLNLRVALADDSSQSDRLAIESGAATGTTRVRVINQGGLGARTTGSGIHVIETSNGATTTSDAFRLDAPVLAGAFRYELFHGGTDDADQQGWYLRSLAPVRDIASLTTALVPVAHNYGLGLVSTLQDREGAKLQSDCDGRTAGGCQWGRVWYRSGEQGARSGGPAFDYDVTNLQVGTDVHIDSQRNSEDRGGIYLNVGFLGADPLRDDGSNAGEIQGRAYSFATYLTHRDASHWYLDSSLVATYLDDLRLEPSDDTRMITSAWTVAASFEGGRRFSLGSRFSVEPQLQLIAQHIQQSDADTVGAHIAFENSDTVAGRAGVSLAADIDPNRWSVWLRANYWSDLAGDAQTTISANDGAAATVFNSDFEDSWLEIAAGIAARFSPHARMHFSISNTEGLGDSDSQALQGNVGVQVQW
jgi:outer membrane autotransporter protein